MQISKMEDNLYRELLYGKVKYDMSYLHNIRKTESYVQLQKENYKRN